MPTEDGGFTPTTECKQNIIILKTNLLQLEDKEATSSLEYARIETQLQNLKQDPTCTIQERPRALAIQTTTKSPSIRSEVISFAVPALTVPTNTNDFCTTTAFTLQSQLDTLGSRQIPVLQKLNQSIDKLKGAEKINESQRDLASLFQNVAAESLTKAWTAL